MLKIYSFIFSLLLPISYTGSINPGPSFASYFSEIEVLPLTNEKDITYSFVFNCPLGQAENYTVFSLTYDQEVIASFSARPGMQLQGSFTLPKEKIKNKETELLFLAETSTITTKAKFQVHYAKEEILNIHPYLNGETKQVIENVIEGLDQKGKRYNQNEMFTWCFEEKNYTKSCYIFDTSKYIFQYEGKKDDIEKAEVEIFIFGTMDDFPRLYFDENQGGYSFKGKVIKKENHYEIALNETFFVDKKTHMISRASGDYFQETAYLHFSQNLKEKKKSFPLRITLKNVGLERNTFIYEGEYEFLYEPFGNYVESLYYLLEEESDERLTKEWEEW